jgi:PAS domain S-box-containing protein
MTFVFFIYGLAFFTLGISLALYPTKGSSFKFAETLRYIAAFGILHGFNEWVDMAILIQSHRGAPFLGEIRNILIVASFYCLFLFGLKTLSKARGRPDSLGAFPLIFLAAWAGLVLMSRDRFLMADIWGRYMLGFPGASLTFAALWVQAAEVRELGLKKPARFLKVAGGAFLIYSVLSGLVVPEAGFFPASMLNYRIFIETFGIPVQIFRAVCAVVIAYSMLKVLEIFDWETADDLRGIRKELEREVDERTGYLIEINEELEQEIADRRKAEKELVKDIAERKEVEEDLLRTKQTLQKILESIPYGVILVGRDKRIRFVNDSALALTGYGSMEELEGKTCHSTLCPVEVDECPILDLGQEMDRTERKARRKTGELVPILKSVVPVTLDGEELFLESFVDITELKLAQEALKESETRNRALLNAIPDIMFRINGEGVFLDYKSAKDMPPPMSPGKFIGARISDVMPGEVARKGMDKVGKALKSEREQVFNYEIQMHGDQRHYEARFVKSGEDEVLAIVRDVTEHRKLEEQLRHAQKMEALGTLTGGIAHEFNNILTAILGYGEFLQDGLETDHPLRSYADMIAASARRAARLTDGLLAYSRKQIVRMEPTDINEIIMTTERYFSSLIGENITLDVVTTEKDLPVTADRAQIEHVLINLATNAIDAMPRGGDLTISTERVEFARNVIEHQAEIAKGKYALITVTDTGAGIDEETQKKIFEPFFTTKDVGKGTGLGLSMVYGIVKRHEGYITVESTPGRETTFRVYLPLGSGIASNEEPVHSSFPAAGVETLLIAEDDAAVRDLIKQILEQAGYTVIEAADGEDAVERFMERKDAVDLLLFDVAMPRMDGRSAYEVIRKTRPGAKVIFISGYVSDDERARRIVDEGYTLISKPVSPKELLAKIRDALKG